MTASNESGSESQRPEIRGSNRGNLWTRIVKEGTKVILYSYDMYGGQYNLGVAVVLKDFDRGEVGQEFYSSYRGSSDDEGYNFARYLERHGYIKYLPGVFHEVLL